MSDNDRDTLMRLAAFEQVRRLGEVHDHLTANELKPGGKIGYDDQRELYARVSSKEQEKEGFSIPVSSCESPSPSARCPAAVSPLRVTRMSVFLKSTREPGQDLGQLQGLSGPEGQGLDSTVGRTTVFTAAVRLLSSLRETLKTRVPYAQKRSLRARCLAHRPLNLRIEPWRFAV